MTALEGLWPYLILIMVGFLPNEIWRMLGVVVSHGIDEGSELIVWVRAVATAILTGVVAKIIVFAPGALAAVPLSVRLTAAAAGMAAFFLLKRSVLAGVVVGTLGILVGVWAVG
jgi:Branched-chain amino acid transport protein (AzlD)